MIDKEKYLKYANETFKGKSLELVLNQIELFYKWKQVPKKHYKNGEDVILKKHSFISISDLIF